MSVKSYPFHVSTTMSTNCPIYGTTLYALDIICLPNFTPNSFTSSPSSSSSSRIIWNAAEIEASAAHPASVITAVLAICAAACFWRMLPFSALIRSSIAFIRRLNPLIGSLVNANTLRARGLLLRESGEESSGESTTCVCATTSENRFATSRIYAS